MPTLDWLNRPAAFAAAAQVPYRLLEQVSVHGQAKVASADNLLIQGDATAGTLFADAGTWNVRRFSLHAPGRTGV